MDRILLLDDSPPTLQRVQNMLTEAGHGIAQFMNQPFAMLVTDIYMLGADGIEIIPECRRSQPAVKIVPMSAREGHGDVLSAARMMGAAVTFAKPFAQDRFLFQIDAPLSAER